MEKRKGEYIYMFGLRDERNIEILIRFMFDSKGREGFKWLIINFDFFLLQIPSI